MLLGVKRVTDIYAEKVHWPSSTDEWKDELSVQIRCFFYFFQNFFWEKIYLDLY